MEVRNLNELVKSHIGININETEQQTKWQVALFGGSYNMEQHISHLTKFATETGTQIFYEFLQNANDAKAESILFFVEEGNLLVINTGLPFYSDKGAINTNARKGQLYAFLTKGDKYDDPNSDGKYGQGAKLLYNLLLSVHSGIETELYDVVAKKLNGPILFSWANSNSFENLRYLDLNTLKFTGNCNDEMIPLLCKIVNTNYPAFLGEVLNGKELFKKTELQKCLDFLKKNEILPLTTHGSLLYIPLGKDQHIELLRLLQGDLKTGMEGSLCHLQYLQKIEINGKPLKKANFEIIDFEDFTLGLPKNQMGSNFYNFYLRYPITETTYGLNFIINSKIYEVDSARQRIATSVANKTFLAKISTDIIEHINKISNDKNKNISQLVTIIKCILTSNPKDNDSLGIKKMFYDDLLETIETALPTAANTIEKASNVRIKETQMIVNLKELGINWHFLSEELSDCNTEILGVEKVTIIDILQAAGEAHITKWISGLEDSQYRILLSEIASYRTPNQVQNLRFIKANDNLVYTPNELAKAPDKILLYPEIKTLQDTLHRLKIVCSDKMVAEYNLLIGEVNYEKLVSLVNNRKFNGKTSDKWEIVKCLKQNDLKNSLTDLIRNELVIFKNINGEKCSLAELYYGEINLASGIIKGFYLRADQYDTTLQNYLMQPSEIWEHLINTKESWDIHVLPCLKAVKYAVVMQDIQNVYDVSDTKTSIPLGYAWIRTNDDKYLVYSEVYFNENIINKNVNEIEYKDLCEFVQNVTNLKTLLFSDIEAINKISFAQLPNLTNIDLAQYWAKNEIAITEKQLAVLRKVQQGNRFLSAYIIQKNEENYKLKKKGGREKQYICGNQNVNIFLEKAKPQIYFLLPSKLQAHYQADESLQKTDDNFTANLIEEYGAEHCFIGLVSTANNPVKKQFLDLLAPFELFEQTMSFNIKEIIKLYTHEDWVEEFRSKILLNEIPISEHTYSHEVSVVYGDNKKADFNLADLIPKQKEKAEAIEKAKEFLKDLKIGYGKLFGTKPYLKQDIAAFLLSQDIRNTEQLCFLWAYKKSKDGSAINLNTLNLLYIANSSIELLTSVYKNNLIFFTEFTLPQNCFNPKKYISDTQNELTLKDERLPVPVENWLKEAEQKKRKDFLIDSGLFNAHSLVIKVRQALLENNILSTELQITDDYIYQHLANTLIWAENQAYKGLSKDSPRYTLLQMLIAKLVTYNKQKTSHCLYLNEDLTLRFSNCAAAMYHITKSIQNEDSQMWKDAISHLKPTIEIMDASHYFTPEIRQQFGIAVELQKEFDETEAQKAQEWDNVHYKAWQEIDAKDYQIYTTKAEVPFKYQITNTKFVKTYNRGIAKRLEKKIYAFFNNENPFEFLMDNQSTLFEFDSNILMLLIKRAWKTPKDEANEEGSGGNGNVTVPEEKKEVIDELAKWDKDTLEAVLNGSLKPSKDEESAASELVGRIGEELAMKWLRGRGLNPEHVAVTKDEKAFDILVLKDETNKKRYIDAKTTTKPVIENNASVPLHIHKEAMKFLEADSNRNYFIIRISLADIGIAHWNKELKDEFEYFGEGRELSPELIDEIKARVEAFWQEKENRDVFEQTVKEFRLNIPKIPKE